MVCFKGGVGLRGQMSIADGDEIESDYIFCDIVFMGLLRAEFDEKLMAEDVLEMLSY